MILSTNIWTPSIFIATLDYLKYNRLEHATYNTSLKSIIVQVICIPHSSGLSLMKCLGPKKFFFSLESYFQLEEGSWDCYSIWKPDINSNVVRGSMMDVHLKRIPFVRDHQKNLLGRSMELLFCVQSKKAICIFLAVRVIVVPSASCIWFLHSSRMQWQDCANHPRR